MTGVTRIKMKPTILVLDFHVNLRNIIGLMARRLKGEWTSSAYTIHTEMTVKKSEHRH